MEDPLSALAPDDDPRNEVNLKEHEDASERSRIVAPPLPASQPVPNVASMSKAIGAGQFSKQEAEKLRKLLGIFRAEDEDMEDIHTFIDPCEHEAGAAFSDPGEGTWCPCGEERLTERAQSERPFKTKVKRSTIGGNSYVLTRSLPVPSRLSAPQSSSCSHPVAVAEETLSRD